MRAPTKKPSGNRPLVLLTGFGPFPGLADNPTGKLVPELARRGRVEFPAYDFETEILATVWQAAPPRAAELHAHHEPALVLHFGVAKSAQGFRIESQARNACQLTLDAHGDVPATKIISPGGPHTRPVTIPTRDIISQLQQRGYPVELSDDAGDYLCNAVLYHSLNAASATASRVPATGFIHIPADLCAGALSYEAAVAGALAIIGVCIAALPQTKD